MSDCALSGLILILGVRPLVPNLKCKEIWLRGKNSLWADATPNVVCSSDPDTSFCEFIFDFSKLHVRGSTPHMTFSSSAPATAIKVELT